MLRNFRSVFKDNQTPMTLVMGVVLVGMVAYLAPTGSDRSAPDNVIARVYGRDILRRDVEQTMGEMMKRYGRQANMDAMMPYIQAQALQQLESQRLMEVMAERHHIVVTDDEVRMALQERLRSYPVFIDEKGQLRSTTEINDILRNAGMTIQMWEREARERLQAQKLMSQAASLVPVDEAWIQHENAVNTVKLSFDSVNVVPDVSAIADPGDQVLAAFLKAGGDRFQVGLRRVIQYVAVDQASLAGSIKVDDANLQAAYQAKKNQYTELKVRHILFKGEGEAAQAEALKKAEALRPKLIAGQDFAKTADDVTEDPGSKGKGGEYTFHLGTMVKPFEDAALALKPGEISQPVKTQYGYHLIKLESRSEKPFDSVKEELRSQVTRERFTQLAKEKLEQLRKRAGKGDLGAAARALGLKVAVSTPFLNDGDLTLPGLTGAGMITGDAFRLKVGSVSTVKAVGDQYLVFRVQEEKPATVPPLSEIRNKVLTAYKLEEARKKAFERAQAAAKSGNLAELGTLTTKDDTTIQAQGELGKSPAIQKALLETAVGSITPVLWTSEGQVWVARIKTRGVAEALTFEKRQTLVQQIQSSVSQKVLTAEMEDLEAKGRQRPGLSSLWGRFGGIYENKDLLTRADALPAEDVSE